MAEHAAPPASRLLRPLLLAAGLLAAGFALRALPLRGLAATRPGPASYVLLGTVACAVGIPRQAVVFAGGYVFGTARGLPLALIAQLAGCVLDLAWARLVAREWVAAHMGPRLVRLARPLATHPFGATLSLRLLPVGNNLLLNLAGGALGIPIAPFLAASALGYLPQTLVFVLLGGGTRLAHGTQLALGVATFILSMALGLWLMRGKTGRGRSG